MSKLHFLLHSNRIFEPLQKKLTQIGYSVERIATVNSPLESVLEAHPQTLILESFDKYEQTLDLIKKTVEKYPECQILVLYSSKSLVDVGEIVNEGALAALQIPYEEARIISSILEAAPIYVNAENITLECLQRVVLAEMDPEAPLEFDLFIYLQANKKLFLYRQKDSVLSQSQYEKFQKRQFNQLYVRKTELKQFREFAAKRMKQIYQSGWVSETERVELLQKEVRALLTPLFDSSDLTPAQSKEILENCKQVVADFITNVVPSPELYKQLLALSAQNYGSLQHAINVSAYTSLFALALGYKDVEAAALGGLLHDIGLSTLRPEISELRPEQMSAAELEEFKRHIPAAIELLQKKKIPAADTVISIVQQHHEFADGTGFPLGLSQIEIHPLARICAIADDFDELTSIRENSPSLSPQAAINYLAAYNSLTSVPQKLDHEMVVKLVEILQVPETKIDRAPFQEILNSRLAESGKSKEHGVENEGMGIDGVPLDRTKKETEDSGITNEDMALLLNERKKAA